MCTFNLFFFSNVSFGDGMQKRDTLLTSFSPRFIAWHIYCNRVTWHRWHRSILQAVPGWLNPKVAKMDRNGRVGEDTGESSYEADCGMTNQLCSSRTGTLCSFRGGWLLQREKWERAGERARSGLIRLATEIDRPSDRSSVRRDARTPCATPLYVLKKDALFNFPTMRANLFFRVLRRDCWQGISIEFRWIKLSLLQADVYMCHNIIVHVLSLNRKFL
jgi:hypothetical protein